MQKTQNADTQRVMSLVDFYRTKVGKESDLAKAAKADYYFWEEVNMKEAEENFAQGEVFSSFVSGEGPHTEVWIKGLKVNEQLLGHFYAEVAGKNAEKDILDQLLSEVYDTSVFTEEEECFLKSHFREMVNYIIQTPNNDLTWVNRYESKDELVIPDEVLELIKSRVEIIAGSTIYYPHVGLAQLANLFQGCNSYVVVKVHGLELHFLLIRLMPRLWKIGKSHLLTMLRFLIFILCLKMRKLLRLCLKYMRMLIMVECLFCYVLLNFL